MSGLLETTEKLQASVYIVVSLKQFSGKFNQGAAAAFKPLHIWDTASD